MLTATPTHKLYTFSDGDIQVAPAAPYYIGYRVKHAVEPGARVTPNGEPEVDPSINIDSIKFTREMQLLSWEVMHKRNLTITKSQWRAVFSTHRAYTNQQGFGDDTPRADYVNGLDLNGELPRLMKAIIAGGAFVRGVMDSKYLTVTPGVGAVDTRKPLPTAQEVIDKHWYFVATTAKYSAEGEWHVNDFPQGNGGEVAIVYFLDQPAQYTKSWFQPWEGDALPNPYRLYLA